MSISILKTTMRPITVNITTSNIHTHNCFTALWICPGQPGWAGTRRNIHPLQSSWSSIIPICFLPSTTTHGILHIQSTCSTVFFHNLSLSFTTSNMSIHIRVAWWRSGWDVGFMIERSWVQSPAVPLPGNNSGQVAHTCVPLSPSSIIWYRCKSRGGNGRLWKRCGLLSITPGVSPLPAQDRGKGDEHPPQRRIVCLRNYTDHGNNFFHSYHQLKQPFHSEVYNSPNGTHRSKNAPFPPLVSLSEERKP